MPANLEQVRARVASQKTLLPSLYGQIDFDRLPERFTEDRLRIAHAQAYRKSLVDIISMVKHAVKEEEPLLTSTERVERAFERLTRGRTFAEPQRLWLDRIREHLTQNLSIDRDDFDTMPLLQRPGGWGAANREFDGQLSTLLVEINEAVAA